MSANQLTPGTYKLNQDVENPLPDRRANQGRITSWHKWAVWPQGLIFIIEEAPSYSAMAGYPVMRLYARGGHTMDAFTRADVGYQRISEALEPVEEAVSDYLTRRYTTLAGTYALDILDRLKVTVEDIAAIADQIDAEES